MRGAGGYEVYRRITAAHARKTGCPGIIASAAKNKAVLAAKGGIPAFLIPQFSPLSLSLQARFHMQLPRLQCWRNRPRPKIRIWTDKKPGLLRYSWVW